jgi:serine/threonine protein kinase
MVLILVALFAEPRASAQDEGDIPRRTPTRRPEVSPKRPSAPDEDGNLAPAPMTQPPPAPPISRPSEQGGQNWLLIAAAIVGLGLMAGLVVVIVRAQPGKKRAKTVTFSDDQIDNYRLINLLMTGHTSQVWEAAEATSGRHFAIKVLLPENVHSPLHRQFLFHEAEVTKQIVHPNIVKIFEAVKHADHPYLVMEFFPSTNLKLRLTRKDPLVKEHIREIIEQTATALAFMHSKGWVHRDVKPDNILVNASAEVRLIDFALTQRLVKRKKGMLGRQKRVGKAMGTRSYMSPEQIRGEALDGRADLYSFGATMYELLAGRPPFRAASPEDLLNKQVAEAPASPELYNPEIHRDMAALILAMLAKDPDERPRDFADFLMRFRKLRTFKVVAQKKA